MTLALTTIQIVHEPENAKTIGYLFSKPSGSKREALLRIYKLFQQLAFGGRRGSVSIHIQAWDEAANTATITCVYANTDADDTVTIGGTVLTAKASGASGESQFNLGTTDATMATNLGACITAHSVLSQLVTASVAAAVITLTSRIKGVEGKGIALASSDSDGIVVSAAFLSGATCTETKSWRTYNRARS